LAGALLIDENIRQRTVFLVWIAGCRNSSLTSRIPKNNGCLSCIFGALFGGKDRCLCPYKPCSERARGLAAFLYLAAQNLNSFQILKIKIKKLKIYSG
jgi:hypothetical protein